MRWTKLDEQCSVIHILISIRNVFLLDMLRRKQWHIVITYDHYYHCHTNVHDTIMIELQAIDCNKG